MQSAEIGAPKILKKAEVVTRHTLAREVVDAEGYYPKIKIEHLRDAPDNPRKRLGDLTELAASIESLGILQPLVATPRDGGLLLVAGHRRKAAAVKAGLKTVPVVVREMTEPERIEAMLVENLQREDLTVVEEARSYHQLEGLGLSQRAIAEKVGKSQGHVSKRVALLVLPNEALSLVEKGELSVTSAAELTRLAPYPKQLKEALKRGGNISKWQADSAIQRAKHELAERELKARCKASGATFVKGVPGYYGFRPPEGTYRLGRGHGELPIDERKHRTEPCHGLGLDPDGDKVVPCCTDRSRHPDLKTKGEETTGARTRVDLAAAARARRDVCIGAVRSLPASELQAIVVEHLIAQSHHGLWRVAADSEGIDLGPDPENHWSPAGRARLDLMRAMLTSDASAIGSLRIAALVALLKFEENQSASPTMRATHMERLSKWGYTPSEAEQRAIEEHAFFEDEDEMVEDDEDLEDNDA